MNKLMSFDQVWEEVEQMPSTIALNASLQGEIPIEVISFFVALNDIGWELVETNPAGVLQLECENLMNG